MPGCCIGIDADIAGWCPPGWSMTDSGELGGPDGGSWGEVGRGSTVTASWIGRPSSRTARG